MERSRSIGLCNRRFIKCLKLSKNARNGLVPAAGVRKSVYAGGAACGAESSNGRKVSATAQRCAETAASSQRNGGRRCSSMDSRCNLCGVPENRWEDGFCRECRHSCEMTPDMIISQRAFQYANKHGLLDTHASFNARAIREKLGRIGRKKKVPKYLREAASCNGLSFPPWLNSPVARCIRFAGTAWMESFWWVTWSGALPQSLAFQVVSILFRRPGAWMPNTVMQPSRGLCSRFPTPIFQSEINS